MKVTETNLDNTDLDAISAEEAEVLKRWYATTHGEGDLTLASHVPFLIEHDPGAFKRQRRYMQVTRDDENGLPLFAIGLIFLYGYVVLRDERGIFYELIAAREWGARKDEVLATAAAAYLRGGPIAINLLADRAGAYLAAWEDEEAGDEGPDRWPEGWGTGAEASGEAEEPAYARLLAQHQPEALAALRERLDHTVGRSVLPPQIFPLFELFTAALRGPAASAAEAVTAGHRLGVSKDHVLEVLCWAWVYVDEPLMNAVSEAVAPLLDAWGR